jgi:hypothetical protein
MIELPNRPNATRTFRFEIPFVRDISKNRVFFAGASKAGAPIMKRRGSVDKIQKAIAFVVSVKVGNEPWPKKTKTWIDVVVQKPDNRSDAHNCVDVLFDGIRDGIGVDDRWFAIGVLDWEVQPMNPNIYVQVSV